MPCCCWLVSLFTAFTCHENSASCLRCHPGANPNSNPGESPGHPGDAPGLFLVVAPVCQKFDKVRELAQVKANKKISRLRGLRSGRKPGLTGAGNFSNLQNLFTTDPHGEQTVARLVSESEGFTLHNQIFQIKDTAGRAIVLTGEEMTDLAGQWLKYVLSQTKPKPRKK